MIRPERLWPRVPSSAAAREKSESSSGRSNWAALTTWVSVPVLTAAITALRDRSPRGRRAVA